MKLGIFHIKEHFSNNFEECYRKYHNLEEIQEWLENIEFWANEVEDRLNNCVVMRRLEEKEARHLFRVAMNDLLELSFNEIIVNNSSDKIIDLFDTKFSYYFVEQFDNIFNYMRKDENYNNYLKFVLTELSNYTDLSKGCYKSYISTLLKG